MKTILKKFVPLLAAFLVTVGGLLAFESFTGDRVVAQSHGSKTIYACNNGSFLAVLCLQNKSKGISDCTRAVPLRYGKNLTVPFNSGDHLDFAAQVVAGKDAHYIGLGGGFDNYCWVSGTSAKTKAYCRRKREESDC